MDKLADGLQKLNEDDLLQVVQMVHDNKAPDSYTKNDVERKYSFLILPFSITIEQLQMERLTHLSSQWVNSTSTCTPSQTL